MLSTEEHPKLAEIEDKILEVTESGNIYTTSSEESKFEQTEQNSFENLPAQVAELSLKFEKLERFSQVSSSSLSDWEEEIETVTALIVQEEATKSSRPWVHKINKKRDELGEFHHLIPELQQCPKRFHMYFRMSKEKFAYLHELVRSDIEKQDTQFRRAISSEERLAVCLR
ncbi:hypothetical protein FQA39_LY15859 [Lamprigera yunnana]|nr:hypothetical protein FQA39_LY15859 [Lamprigera yunnana]